MSPIASFILFAFMCGAANARYVNKESEASTVAVVSGTLYALENGQSRYRLNRRDLDAVQSSFQEMRLDLGPGMDAIDMQLKQDSAWSNDSRIVVRRGDHAEEVHNSVDSSCYLTGRLTSHDGAATLSRCGRMSGLIEAGEHHYVIEESDDGNFDTDLSNVKVTMKRSSLITSHDDDIVKGYQQETVQEQEEMTINEELSKRQSNAKTVEIGVYLDKNIVNWWRNYRGLFTDVQLNDFIVKKWNIARCVYGNPIDVGFPLAIELKYIEIWRINPAAYEITATTQNDGVIYLNEFCDQMADNPDDNFDHVMLYTQGTGGFEMGRAWIGGVCNLRRKCSFAKAKEDSVRFEVHELGHNLGLPHDTEDSECQKTHPPGGFMAWSWNNKFMPCYRRILASTLNRSDKRCLIETNVNRRVYNTDPPANCIRPDN